MRIQFFAGPGFLNQVQDKLSPGRQCKKSIKLTQVALWLILYLINHMNYWLIKSEGDCYSIDDLKRDKKVAWSGVRNYQARNFMRDDMKVGDLVLFYHSNGTGENPNGIYGVAKVASKPHADETQFDAKDGHYDPKAKDGVPIWACVDMAFVKKFKAPITLGEIKRERHLEGMEVRRTGSRLSVMPVAERHFTYIVETMTK
jgi:predicted RNA-binding protein with PUA-like domain